MQVLQHAPNAFAKRLLEWHNPWSDNGHGQSSLSQACSYLHANEAGPNHYGTVRVLAGANDSARIVKAAQGKDVL